MANDKERCEVAAKLRSVTDEEYRMCFLEEILTGCVGAAYVYDSECQLDVRLMVNRLANLIEPEPERTCRNEAYFYALGSLFVCSECTRAIDEYEHVPLIGEYCTCGAKRVD